MPGQGKHALPVVRYRTYLLLYPKRRYDRRSCMQTGQPHDSPTAPATCGGCYIRRRNTHYFFVPPLTTPFQVKKQPVCPVTAPLLFKSHSRQWLHRQYFHRNIMQLRYGRFQILKHRRICRSQWLNGDHRPLTVPGKAAGIQNDTGQKKPVCNTRCHESEYKKPAQVT